MRYGIQKHASGLMWPETYTYINAAETQKILLGSAWEIVSVSSIKEIETVHSVGAGFSCMCDKCTKIRKQMKPMVANDFTEKTLKCAYCQLPVYRESACVSFKEKPYHTYCLYRQEIQQA